MEFLRTIIFLVASCIGIIILARAMKAYDAEMNAGKTLAVSFGAGAVQYVGLLVGFFLGLLLAKWIPMLEGRFLLVSSIVLAGKNIFEKPIDSEGEDATKGRVNFKDFTTLSLMVGVDSIFIGLGFCDFEINSIFLVFGLFAFMSFITYLIAYFVTKRDKFKVKKILYFVSGFIYLLTLFLL